jgi:hypothetical protein
MVARQMEQEQSLGDLYQHSVILLNAAECPTHKTFTSLRGLRGAAPRYRSNPPTLPAIAPTPLRSGALGGTYGGAK